MNIKHVFLIIAVIMGGVWGCQGNDAHPDTVLTLMTHDSFSISQPVQTAMEKALGAKLRILKAGDAGQALNKAILSKDNPLADIFYGVDNTFMSRALKADLFDAYAPAHLDQVEGSLRMDPLNRLIPVDYGAVCLNYDIHWFKERNLPPPTCLEDLIAPEYKNLTVVQNPATSSPGLAFLLATVSRFGEPGYIDFWERLRDNGVMVKNSWKAAYWGEFTAASEGFRPIVVSYASSPAAEVFYSKESLSAAPTAVVIEQGSAFRQVEFAGIFAAGKQKELARKAMDFILSPAFQEDIPLQMFVFPSNAKARLPKVFETYARRAKAPARIAPERIDDKRDTWIREWTDTVLQ